MGNVPSDGCTLKPICQHGSDGEKVCHETVVIIVLITRKIILGITLEESTAAVEAARSSNPSVLRRNNSKWIQVCEKLLIQPGDRGGQQRARGGKHVAGRHDDMVDDHGTSEKVAKDDSNQRDGNSGSNLI